MFNRIIAKLIVGNYQFEKNDWGPWILTTNKEMYTVRFIPRTPYSECSVFSIFDKNWTVSIPCIVRMRTVEGTGAYQKKWGNDFERHKNIGLLAKIFESVMKYLLVSLHSK